MPGAMKDLLNGKRWRTRHASGEESVDCLIALELGEGLGDKGGEVPIVGFCQRLPGEEAPGPFRVPKRDGKAMEVFFVVAGNG